MRRGSLGDPGIGSAGGSTTTVARLPRGDERLERLSGEREAERVANGSRDVGDRLDRGRRSEHDGVLAGVDHGEPRAVRQGQAGQVSMSP